MLWQLGEPGRSLAPRSLEPCCIYLFSEHLLILFPALCHPLVIGYSICKGIFFNG